MFLSLCLTLTLISSSPVLGSPGAPWTDQETLVVKAKLYAILGEYGHGSQVVNEYLELHPELGLTHWPEFESMPTASKFLRLGFHSCLKYQDGTGGCNGCLSNKNIGLDKRHNCTIHGASDNHSPNINQTDNAGLELTADILEEIFVNKDFPEHAEALPVSLAESGKSRADLWNFAAVVGVEWGLERNNHACDGQDWTSNTARLGCAHIRQFEPDCKIELQQPIKFFTGRSDCQPEAGLKGWETERTERHPNPHGNGVTTADFFRTDFGLTGREGAALLLGAHSFGTFNAVISQFRYDWTRSQGHLLNNQVFRHVSMRPQYFGDCPNEYQDYWHLTGDHLGQPAETRWKVVAARCSEGMGPFQWFHQYYRCPASNTCAGLAANQTVSDRFPLHEYPALSNFDDEKPDGRTEPDTPAECCEGMPSGHYRCHEDCVRRIQNDETALSVDLGYYLDFQVDPETGRPSGCDSFEEAYNYPDWANSKVVDCPKQMYAPEGEVLHEVIDQFADNQDIWIGDFLTALEKMSKNGNDPKELREGPTAWYGALCEKNYVGGVGYVWSCQKEK